MKSTRIGRRQFILRSTLAAAGTAFAGNAAPQMMGGGGGGGMGGGLGMMNWGGPMGGVGG